MAWTAPRTWTTGEVVTAALLNTHLRDNLLAIGDPAAARSNHLLFSPDNTYDIGASGATRPRNVYVAGTVAASALSGTINSVIAGSGINLELGANGAQRWLLTSANGHIQPSADNTYDLGAGGNRVANVVVATSVRVGTNPAASGDIRLANNATINYRNNANSGDIAALQVNTSDNLQTGASAFVAVVHNAQDLGTTGVRWRDVWCQRAAFNGSSRILKRDLTPLAPADALAAVQATEVVAFRYKPTDDEDAGAEAWQVGFVAEDAPDLLSPDHAHANAATTASVALAAIQALAAEVADLKAQLAAALALVTARAPAPGAEGA